MKTVSSHDGTKIAYEKQGQRPALILVNGAMNTHSSGSNPGLADLMAQHLTVYSFDRRGRGESGDTLPYAVAREGSPGRSVFWVLSEADKQAVTDR